MLRSRRRASTARGCEVGPAAFETPHHHGDSVAAAQSQAEDEDVDVDDPAAAVSKPALPDADEWADKKDKLSELIR